MADREARERYAAGLPDHHNLLGGVGGVPPAYSPLTLRLVLAIFGLVVCTAGAVVAFVVGVWGLGAVLIVFAALAAVDIVVIARRKGRGEPG
jgi:hypothetical protein